MLTAEIAQQIRARLWTGGERHQRNEQVIDQFCDIGHGHESIGTHVDVALDGTRKRGQTDEEVIDQRGQVAHSDQVVN